MNGFGHTINSDAFDDWREVQAQRTASAKPMIVACILAVALLAVGALAGTQHAQWALASVEVHVGGNNSPVHVATNPPTKPGAANQGAQATADRAAPRPTLLAAKQE